MNLFQPCAVGARAPENAAGAHAPAKPSSGCNLISHPYFQLDVHVIRNKPRPNLFQYPLPVLFPASMTVSTSLQANVGRHGKVFQITG